MASCLIRCLGAGVLHGQELRGVDYSIFTAREIDGSWMLLMNGISGTESNALALQFTSDELFLRVRQD